MTLAELARWAHDRQRFDECVWVGKDVSIADVKTTVRELLAESPTTSVTVSVVDQDGGL